MALYEMRLGREAALPLAFEIMSEVCRDERMHHSASSHCVSYLDGIQGKGLLFHMTVFISGAAKTVSPPCGADR
jgi:hypothetical protein